jgi:hypothetical protein
MPMDKKRGPGRPKISEKLLGESGKLYESILTNGRQFRSRRSTTDIVYAAEAVKILKEAAAEIEDLELIVELDGHYICRSILNQLGRMRLIENYDKDSIVKIAKLAIYKKKNGCNVKEIEKYIRQGRMTGEWDANNLP